MHQIRMKNQSFGHVFNRVCAIIFFALLVWFLPYHALAQVASESNSVSVGLHESPPFVMRDGDEPPEGMAVDLFDLLTERMGRTPQYTFYPTVRELVLAVEGGEVDVAVTNLTITQQRAETVDFTQPWYDAGLRVMINDDGAGDLGATIQGLWSSGHFEAYAWLALVILIATILLTLFDRKFDTEFHKRWRDGIAHSFHSVMSVAITGRTPARKNLFGWIGKIWSAIWLICGIAVLAYITASVTSVMTTLAITETINGPEDLPGKTIGVSDGSTAEDFARKFNIDARTYDGVASAAQALVDGEIDAVVGDAPVLEYFAHVTPEMNLDVVGQIFQPEKYGFALALNSGLTKSLTIELLGLKEDGTIEEVDSNYFGTDW